MNAFYGLCADGVRGFPTVSSLPDSQCQPSTCCCEGVSSEPSSPLKPTLGSSELQPEYPYSSPPLKEAQQHCSCPPDSTPQLASPKIKVLVAVSGIPPTWDKGSTFCLWDPSFPDFPAQLSVLMTNSLVPSVPMDSATRGTEGLAAASNGNFHYVIRRPKREGRVRGCGAAGLTLLFLLIATTWRESGNSGS